MAVAVLEAQGSEIPDLTYNSAGFADEHSLKKLQAEFAEIAQRIAKQVDDISLRLIDCSTLDEFCALRKKELDSYLNLSMALTRIALVVLDPEDLAHLMQESLAETEKHFITDGAKYLGDEAYREALFSIANLRSAQRLIPRLVSAKPSDDSQDKELAHKFFHASLWANIHLHCLGLAMQRGKTVTRDILQELLDGLRASVMAYAHARAALELRGIPDERYSEKLEVSWDDEDKTLAEAD